MQSKYYIKYKSPKHKYISIQEQNKTKININNNVTAYYVRIRVISVNIGFFSNLKSKQ